MERAREGVAILLNDMWHSSVINFGCVSSRLLRIKLVFCVEVKYGRSEGDGEERERFGNDLDRIVNRVGNWYRLCKL